MKQYFYITKSPILKRYIILVTLLITATISYAQVGIGTSSPASSSQLDVTSTSKGLLPPRMTTSQRDAISSPATGLQIYNTDNRAIETYTGVTGEWFTIGRGKAPANYNLNYNTVTGVKALFFNAGVLNTANGYMCLYSNTTGSYNTACAIYSLYSNTTGQNNTAYGYRSLYSNTIGSQNTANGLFSLHSNTTGSHNTANGYFSLYSNTIGSNNTALGKLADVIANNLSNATALGNGASVSASNRVRIGNSSVSRIGGQVAWTNLSDGRIKENVREAVPGLSFISELRPVTYTLNTRKQDEITMQLMPDSIKERRMLSDADYLESSSIVRTGFIAQEVEAAAKKVGFDFDGVSAPENETDLYGIRYAEFVVPLVKAMQEQQEMITELKANEEEQQATIEQQKNDFQKQLQLLLERIETLEKE
jgi:hypothetical protein